MKKKVLIIFFSIVSLMFALIAFYGTATPPSGNNHSTGSCHGNAGGYFISVTTPVTTDSYTTFNVTATGPNLFVRIYPGAKDNDKFTVLPSTNKIVDGSGDDIDLDLNEMTVMFNITPTVSLESYTLFIIAGNDLTGGQQFAYEEVIIGAPPAFDLWEIIFDHLGLYLGLPALLLLSLGTVLVLVNENKFVKLHGIMAGSSWILTIINVTAAFIKISPQAWLTGYELIYHLPHIILGVAGLITGFFSMLFGIAAERKPARLTGYITLICWWAAFLTGYLLNNDLLLIL